MKNKNILVVVSLILVFITIYIIRDTYGLFESKNIMNTNTNIAKWNVLINGTDIKSGENFVVNSINIVGSDSVKNGKMAPGTEGYFDILIDPTDTAKFIAFDLFFKVNAATPIYLQAGSGVTSADEKDNGIKNASRIAFVKLGETADGSALNTIQALNAGAASTVTVWEPNFDVHTDAGVANAKDVYGITTTAANGALVPYAGIKGAITKAEDILLGEATQEKHEDKFTTVTPGKTSTAAFPANIELMTLNKGITKVRIYMWVEGQDVDCENNASGGNINFDLKISTNAA